MMRLARKKKEERRNADRGPRARGAARAHTQAGRPVGTNARSRRRTRSLRSQRSLRGFGGARGAGGDVAVSEIVATLLLIGFSVAFFAVVGLQVASLPPPSDPIRADLRVGFQNVSATSEPEHRIAMVHQGGDRIPLDSIQVRFEGQDCDLDLPASREDGNGQFDMGEQLVTKVPPCSGSAGGTVIVVGGWGSERGVLMLVQLPAPDR